MPRAQWKGHLSFGLVNIPIILQNSEDTSQRISFHQIDKRNHARIKYQRVNVENGKEVPWEQITRGYEYEKDSIIPVEEGELQKIAGENARTIAIESFINAKDIHFIDIEKTYFLLPDKKGEKGYVILRQALQDTNKVGIAKVIISTKEYLAAVGVFENSLMLYLLHYQDELHTADEFHLPSDDLKKYKVTAKELTVAKQLIQSMTEKWKPQQYTDEYAKAVHKWVNEKIKKRPHTAMKQRAPSEKGAKGVNFVDLLKKSLQQKGKRGKAAPVTAAMKKKINGRSAYRHATRH